MRIGSRPPRVVSRLALALLLAVVSTGAIESQSQTLVNVDFGAGLVSPKVGYAAVGQGTNDFWNLYTHYRPRYEPGSPLVPDGRLEGLRFADGSPCPAQLALTNAPGVWGNETGDPMLDSYVFAPNGSNLVVTITGIEPGRYHFFLYGWAAADGAREHTPAFRLLSDTNTFGPLTASGAAGWRAGQPWREGSQFVVYRDVPVTANTPVLVEVLPGPGGVAVLNGLQILSRGTSPPTVTSTAVVAGDIATNILFRSIAYAGQLSRDQARFAVVIEAESRSTNAMAAPLFHGDLAVLKPKLPPGWRIVKQGSQFTLHAAAPGVERIELELQAKVAREEPWNVTRFLGPPAAVATLTAQALESEFEVQLLRGTPAESPTPVPGTVHGVVGADREVALRWQGRSAEAAREAVVAVETRAVAEFGPAAIRCQTEFQYEVLQARLSQVRIGLPSGHAITQLAGEQVRDWRVTSETGGEVLTVEFIRPIEGRTTLSLVTEQGAPDLPGSIELNLPQPLAAQRETGSLRVQTEDLVARVDGLEGLRQVSATAQDFAAFRFNTRPATLQLHLARVEPVVAVNSRVRAQVEEARMRVRHELALSVSRAGVYHLDLAMPAGAMVTDVQGDGLEDWKIAGGTLQLALTTRLLGEDKFIVQLEQPRPESSAELVLSPLQVIGATRQACFIGAASTAGIQLKTASVTGAREIPASLLPQPQDELLAFRADQGDWRIALTADRLKPRVVAEVFNLITIGNGLVGGSATIRFGIVNQGVQQFRLRLPAHWRNVEFTGPNIRRKDQQDDVWTIALQDKAWGGYTLVITYDHAFDPVKAQLDASGAHPLDVERETGTVAITSAANVALAPGPLLDPLRRIDPTELAAADRGLISRPVLLAYRYEGGEYALHLDLTRHQELSVLDAVADRTELTSVLTGSGEMLTQASFLVKNNERQFQRFELPPAATLWGAAVNGEPVKADRDANGVLIALPRGENRDELFAIDLKYAERVGALGRLFPRTVRLTAPKTDVPGTYAAWTLYVPASRHVYGFGGNMTVAQGTDYGWRDGRDAFVGFYRGLWHDYGAGLIIGGCFLGFLGALVLYGRKRGFRGVAGVLVVFFVIAILAGMLLPALSKAKARAQRINSANNLKQIGLAARMYATEHQDRLPNSFEEILGELGSTRTLHDPETGQRYTYVGAGKSEANPDSILAYSPERRGGGREVVFTDGSVQLLSGTKFAEALARDQAAIAPRAHPAPGMQQQAATPMPQAVAATPTPVVAGGVPGAATPANAPQPQGDATPPLAGLGTVTATATGIKSLKFDLPRAGRAYTFTRTLNASGDPATLSVRLMSGGVFVFLRAALQLAGFLIGLALVIYQWRRVEARAVWLTVGLGLAGLATVDLLIAWRVLGLALIVAVPAVLLFVAAGLFWWWRSRSAVGRPARNPSAPATPGTASAAAGLALVVSLWPGALRAAGLNAPPFPPVSVVSAAYTATAFEQAAQLDATFALLSATTNQVVPLFGKEVAVQEFTPVGGEAEVWRDGENVGVRLPAAGEVSVHFKLLVRLTGDAARRQLDFASPAALGSRLTLTLREPQAEVEFPGAVSLEIEHRPDTTEVRAVLGATERITLSWTPRRKRAAETAATVFAEQTSLVTLGDGVVNTRTELEWQVSQGEVQQLRVRLPEGHRLLKVSGEQLRSWELGGTNRDILTVDLIKPVSPLARLALETEQPLDRLPADVSLRLPEPLEVKRQTGQLGVRATEEVGLVLGQSRGLERVEAVAFTTAFGETAGGVVSAWRFLRPDFELHARVDLLRPRIEAVQRQHFTVGPEQLGVTTRLEYTISRAGLFGLRLALPPDGQIESVSCSVMQQWSEQDEAGRRVLEIALKERTLGTVVVETRWRRSYSSLPATLAMEGAHPLDVEKLTSYVTVATEAGVGVKTSALSGASEVPAATVPGLDATTTGILAFKHVATEPQAAPGWGITLTTERLDAWVRAEIVHFITVGETRLSGQSLVRYEIQNAPVKELRLRTPAAWRNVEILGDGVRRRDHTDGEWRVELQNQVVGHYRLTVHWEQTRTNAERLTVSGAEALGVERETGAVAFLTDGQLQLVPGAIGEQVSRIDARELPDWARLPAGGMPVLSFRYLRPGWQLPLEVQRFESAAVLQGLVDNARLRTVVADDGQHMTQLELTIRNKGRQSVALSLPPQSEVWSAFVDGRPVRPARRGEALLLPLENVENADAPVFVELTYVGTLSFPRTSGAVELASPRLDLPLKDALWELFLPPEYEYSGFRGTMSYESAALVPVSQEFTFAEYQRQELSKRESFEAQAVEVLRRTRTEMATGNLAGVTKLKGLRSAPLRDPGAADELRQLEADVNRVQTSQLLESQRAYTYSNLGRLGASGPGGPPMDARMMQRYGLRPAAPGERAVEAQAAPADDTRVAEQQVAQLQKAQAVAESVVAPLRANLPTRGLRYSFVQVLQTEPDKPLTMRLHARNDRVTGWFGRLVRAAGGFLALWLATSLALAFRRPRPAR